MTTAHFKLDFFVDACLDVAERMGVVLADGSQIMFHKSRQRNEGAVLVAMDEPDTTIAKNVAQQKAESFLTHMLITKGNLETLQPIHIVGFEFLNPRDFKAERIKWYPELVAGVAIPVKLARLEQEELDATSELLAGIERLPLKKKGVMSRSLRWFRRASETAKEDRFIFRWISFETLLGLLERRKATQKLILEFVDRFLETETARRIFARHQGAIECLSDADLISYRGVRYSEQLQKLIKKNGDPRAVLPKAAVCIFEVRNSLFHKGEVIGLMEKSSSLLRDVTRECLRCYVQREAG